MTQFLTLDQTNAIVHDYRRDYKPFSDRICIEETINPSLLKVDEIFRECFLKSSSHEVPITLMVFENAKKAINSVSGDLIPSVELDEDGSVGLEWFRNPNCIVSVNINPDGNLYYASLIDGSRDRGTRSLSKEFPIGMLSSIRQVIESNA